MSRRLILLLCALLMPISASAQTIIPFITQQFLNAAGAPCNGCTLDTWAAGTTTAQATFSDSALTTQNANPVVMDSQGRPTTGAIYLSATSYQFRLRTSAGVNIWTIDNISYVPTAAGNVDLASQTAGVAIAAGEAVYLSDGSGSLTAGRWYLADSDNTYSSNAAVLVGIAPSAIASGASGTIRIGGRATGLSGLTAGEIYYAGATAGALVTAPPTNAMCLGKAASTTTLIMPCETPVVRVADSDGTNSYLTRSDANLTADRLVVMNFGDAAGVITHPALNVMEGRCTLTSGTAVTTADVTAATTLFYTPYTGNRITLYDGTAQWNTRTFTEMSIAVPATTATMYDVFIDYTAGTPALETVAWTNDTTRATALATQNGVYVQTSDTDSRYVCSFRTTGVSGQTEDSVALRFVWNYYNRVFRPMRVLEATNTWTYTTATWRQARATAANQLDFVIGVSEDQVEAQVLGIAENDTGNVAVLVGIGLDSTTANATGLINSRVQVPTAARQLPVPAMWRGYPGAGRHFLAWLEYSGATGITTWSGDDGGTLNQAGIHGVIRN